MGFRCEEPCWDDLSVFATGSGIDLDHQEPPAMLGSTCCGELPHSSVRYQRLSLDLAYDEVDNRPRASYDVGVGKSTDWW